MSLNFLLLCKFGALKPKWKMISGICDLVRRTRHLNCWTSCVRYDLFLTWTHILIIAYAYFGAISNFLKRTHVTGHRSLKMGSLVLMIHFKNTSVIIFETYNYGDHREVLTRTKLASPKWISSSACSYCVFHNKKRKNLAC